MTRPDKSIGDVVSRGLERWSKWAAVTLSAALVPAFACAADAQDQGLSPRASARPPMSARMSQGDPRQRSDRAVSSLGVSAPRRGGDRTPTHWQFESTEGYETGDAIAISDRWVAVGGGYFTSLRPCQRGVSCGQDARVRVFDAATGELRWTSDFDLDGTGDLYQAVAVEGDVVLAIGYSLNRYTTNNRPVWVVNAYDAPTGKLLWHEALADPQTDFYPEAIATRGGKAYVTGVAGPQCYFGSWCEQLTRAYDIATGKVLWTVRNGMPGVDYESLSIAAEENGVYIAGNAGQYAEVRALDARTGSLRWLDQIPDPLGGIVFKVVADEDRVAIGAFVNGDWLLRVYHAESGHVRWTRTWSLTGNADPTVYDAPVVLAMRDGVVVAGGYGSHLADGTEPYPKASRDWVVRAYEVSDGRLLWSDVRGALDDTDEANGGVAILHGQAVVLGFGAFDDATGNTHPLVRSYDLRSGALVWEDLEPRVGFAYGVTKTLASADGRVAAVSRVQGPRPAGLPPPDSFGVDMLVRVYDLRERRR